MTPWLPRPLLSAVLLAVWLLLNATLAPAHIALGALLAVAIPLWVGPLLPAPVRLRRGRTALRLALVVLGDIVLANIEVARRILGPESALAPGFVRVPLALRGDWSVATLAGIVTLTPGTVSAEVSADHSELLVHALHVTDPQALVEEIKRRYEAPLEEIFG
jgi:multicomponent K+:H+ antiporter subunit E